MTPTPVDPRDEADWQLIRLLIATNNGDKASAEDAAMKLRQLVTGLVRELDRLRATAVGA